MLKNSLHWKMGKNSIFFLLINHFRVLFFLACLTLEAEITC